jgi:hypothetical protein
MMIVGGMIRHQRPWQVEGVGNSLFFTLAGLYTAATRKSASHSPDMYYKLNSCFLLVGV